MRPIAVMGSASPEPSPAEAGAQNPTGGETLTGCRRAAARHRRRCWSSIAALGFTVDEMASTVGRSVETVRSRLRLAKQAIRERIESSRELTEYWS